MKLLDSIFFLYKPPNITSFDVLKIIKKNIVQKFHNEPKIGHTGTLDKFAEGLMILLIGKSTVLSEYFLKKDKLYIAEIQIGKSTDTLDPEGEILEEWDSNTIKDFVLNHKEYIQKEIHNFINQKEQIPPEYSAVKIQGKRASDWMREGNTVIIQPKSIEIYQSDVLQIHEDGRIIAKFHVSSGTYIRSIARDLGKKIQAPTMLNRLQRISISKWSIFDPYVNKIDMDNYIFCSPLDILNDWDKIVIPDNLLKFIANGVKIQLDLNEILSENFFLVSKHKQILAWGKKLNHENYLYKKVFTR